jgi:hypothetical protein
MGKTTFYGLEKKKVGDEYVHKNSSSLSQMFGKYSETVKMMQHCKLGMLGSTYLICTTMLPRLDDIYVLSYQKSKF